MPEDAPLPCEASASDGSSADTGTPHASHMCATGVAAADDVLSELSRPVSYFSESHAKSDKAVREMTRPIRNQTSITSVCGWGPCSNTSDGKFKRCQGCKAIAYCGKEW